jgi:hypothetical protein
MSDSTKVVVTKYDQAKGQVSLIEADRETGKKITQFDIRSSNIVGYYGDDLPMSTPNRAICQFDDPASAKEIKRIAAQALNSGVSASDEAATQKIFKKLNATCAQSSKLLVR